jgi:hypothetical protein
VSVTHFAEQRGQLARVPVNVANNVMVHLAPS